MGVLGIIPARGGSKGVKDKNIIKIAGKPLISHTIEAALESNFLDKVVVSTDSEKIAEVVRQSYAIETIMRPPEFARDDSPIEESFVHAIEYLKKKEGFETDILVWMQPNVPIREHGIIDRVLTSLLNSPADACVTCYEVDQVPEVMKVIDENGYLRPLFEDVDGIRRQEFQDRYLLDGSVVAIRAHNLIETKGIRKAHVYLGKDVIPIIQSDRMYSVEIDVPDDIALVEFYFQKLNSTNVQR